MLAIKKWAAASAPLPLLVIFVLFTGCTPPGPRALLEGEQLINRGEYQKAVEKLKQATELLPQNAQAWNHLGLAQHGAGKVDDAIRSYQQALAQGRNLAIAHYNLGCLYFEHNNYAAAVDELRAYTILQPQFVPAWQKLAAAQLRLRQFDAAEKTYRYLLGLNPKQADVLNALGIIQLHQRNRARDSIQYFNAALQQDPTYGPALYNLAVASQFYFNNRPVALQKYREYLALNPRPEQWQTVSDMAAQLELELNPPPKVPVTNVVTSPVLPPPSNTVARVTTTNIPKTEVISAPKTNPVSPVKSAPIETPKPEPPPPVKETPVEVTRVPEPLVIKPAQDKVAEAPKQVATAPAPINQPETTPATTNKPGFFQRLNPFRKSTKTSPTPLNNSPVVITNQPVEPVKPSGITPLPPQLGAAHYTYRSPARPEPGNRTEAEPHFAKGLLAHRKGQFVEAIAEYQKALQSDPAYFEAQHNLALAASENGELPRALAAFETALAIQPGSPLARHNFAITLRDSNYYQDAANELEKLLAAAPAEADAHLTLANLYAQQFGRKDLARAHYQKVLQLNPRHPNATDIRYWLAANP